MGSQRGRTPEGTEKIPWHGTLTSVQPRIRLTRSFDQRRQTYLGFVLRVEGMVGDEKREFVVVVSKGAHAKHQFRVGDAVSGVSRPVADVRVDMAEFYDPSMLCVLERPGGPTHEPPPWLGPPPELSVYQERRYRKLAAGTYTVKCWNCIWGCKMPVEMIIDHWKPQHRRHRFEILCYGPESCHFYQPGPARKAPGWRGMV